MTLRLWAFGRAQHEHEPLWALAEEAPLEIVGRGSKRGLGRHFQADHTLDLSGLALPVLAAHDAAARIDQALRIRVRALNALGRTDEAAMAAIDSRAWAYYVTGRGPKP